MKFNREEAGKIRPEKKNDYKHIERGHPSSTSRIEPGTPTIQTRSAND